ncbi:MAG: hypothetical protein ACKERG_04530 [Candidatus Hodgkinia cicadicola]
MCGNTETQLRPLAGRQLEADKFWANVCCRLGYTDVEAGALEAEM